MSLSVFICSIFYTDHSPGELLHILFLAFILSRPNRWVSWCENTKGSRFICHAHRPQTTHRLSPSPFNVSGFQILHCTVQWFNMHTVARHEQKLCCGWLHYSQIRPHFAFLILTHTHAHTWHHPMCAAGLWSESMLRKAPASIDFSDLFSFLAHPHHWVHCYFLHSVIVTCKDTCGVPDVVCSRQITSPEIDQPFCLSLPYHPSFLVIYHTVLLSLAQCSCYQMRWITAVLWLRLWGIMDLYQRSNLSYFL